MLRRIFPRQFDNAYPGTRLAIWLFAALIFMKFMMGFNSIFFTRFVATSADGLNLAAFGRQATDVVVSMYGVVGLSMVQLALIGGVALIRYRSMIPFLYLVLLIQQAGGKALSLWHPSESTGLPSTHTASGFVLAALAITLAGFALSLWSPPEKKSQAAAGASH